MQSFREQLKANMKIAGITFILNDCLRSSCQRGTTPPHWSMAAKDIRQNPFSYGGVWVYQRKKCWRRKKGSHFSQQVVWIMQSGFTNPGLVHGSPHQPWLCSHAHLSRLFFGLRLLHTRSSLLAGSFTVDPLTVKSAFLTFRGWLLWLPPFFLELCKPLILY